MPRSEAQQPHQFLDSLWRASRNCWVFFVSSCVGWAARRDVFRQRRLVGCRWRMPLDLLVNHFGLPPHGADARVPRGRLRRTQARTQACEHDGRRREVCGLELGRAPKGAPESTQMARCAKAAGARSAQSAAPPTRLAVAPRWRKRRGQRLRDQRRFKSSVGCRQLYKERINHPLPWSLHRAHTVD